MQVRSVSRMASRAGSSTRRLLFRALGVEQRDLDAHAPGGCAGRMDGVAVEVDRDVDGLIAEAHDASCAAAEGDGPDAAAWVVVAFGQVAAGPSVPVGGEDWRGG